MRILVALLCVATKLASHPHECSLAGPGTERDSRNRMEGATDRPVTQLLRSWRSGDEAARERLLPLVYNELRHLARRELRRERSGHTLESRELVHEAYMRLMDATVPWEDRAHFFALAARTMRRVLVDHARTKRRRKRGDRKSVV